MNPESSPTPNEENHPESGMPRLIRIVVFIVSLHVVFFGGLLIQGCKKSAAPSSEDSAGLSLGGDDESLPKVDSAYYNQWDTNMLNPITDFPPLEAEEPLVQPEVEKPVPPPTTNLKNQTINTVASKMTTPHTVERGETFYGIAKKYNVPLKAILNANPEINPQALRPGMTVEIPPQEPPSLEAEVVLDDGSTYTVRRGDSLYKIAQMHQVSVADLMKENKLTSSVIHPDQKLKIPKLDQRNQ